MQHVSAVGRGSACPQEMNFFHSTGPPIKSGTIFSGHATHLTATSENTVAKRAARRLREMSLFRSKPDFPVLRVYFLLRDWFSDASVGAFVLFPIQSSVLRDRSKLLDMRAGFFEIGRALTQS